MRIDFKLRGIGRGVMGLLIVNHLGTVLKRAQESISRFQFIRSGLGDPFGMGQSIERIAGFDAAQSRVAPACNQLLGLRKKFNFANAAATKFEVVTEHGNFAMSYTHLTLP